MTQWRCQCPAWRGWPPHSMCSSPHWQVGWSWFREKLSPADQAQRRSRWANFTKNCIPRIGSKELPLSWKISRSWAPKNGVQHATAIYPIPRYTTRPGYIGSTLYIYVPSMFYICRLQKKTLFCWGFIISIKYKHGFVLLGYIYIFFVLTIDLNGFRWNIPSR